MIHLLKPAIATLLVVPIVMACSNDRAANVEPQENQMQSQMSSSIVEIAVNDERFSTLVAAVTSADLVDTLSGEGPFTVLAPTNEAFAKLPEGVLETLLLPENKQALTDILLYHVIPGAAPAEAVLGLVGSQVATALGQSVQVRLVDGELFINDSKVIITDVFASNGVIHVIDTVLLPSN